MIGFTKALALEVASRNITVNAVAPGLIDTDMTRALPAEAQEDWAARIPLKRLGTPEDVADAVCVPRVRRGVVYYGTRARRQRRDVYVTGSPVGNRAQVWMTPAVRAGD